MRKHNIPVKPRILLADATQDLVDVYGYLFTAAGYQVSRAYEGHAAAALAKVAQPDIALLNEHLPGQTGRSILKDLRAAGARTKVIITSGMDGFAALAEGALADGAVFCVRQPCPAEQLLRMVSAVLARPRSFKS